MTVSKKENLKFLVNEVYYKIGQIRNPKNFDNSYCASLTKFDDEMDIISDNLLWQDIIWDGDSI